jgi:outer membrane murein-binding lipoprotein Lpp
MIDIEELTDDELEQLSQRFRRIRARCESLNGKHDSSASDVKAAKGKENSKNQTQPSTS